jgi:hypothetical protein
MTKAYLTQKVNRREGEENPSDFTLDDNPEKAAWWDSKEQANIKCLLLTG